MRVIVATRHVYVYNRAALAVGRRSLATMLLDLEPLAGDQVSIAFLL
jgi:hypothetical protein